MVGDGINDAPVSLRTIHPDSTLIFAKALSTADVSLAIGSGSEFYFQVNKLLG